MRGVALGEAAGGLIVDVVGVFRTADTLVAILILRRPSLMHGLEPQKKLLLLFIIFYENRLLAWLNCILRVTVHLKTLLPPLFQHPAPRIDVQTLIGRKLRAQRLYPGLIGGVVVTAAGARGLNHEVA